MKVLAAILPAAAIAAALAIGIPAAGAKDASDRAGSSWTHPGLADFAVDRIAMLPVATYDSDYAAEKQIERAVGAALRESGYRWISATGTRSLMQANGADSLLAALRSGVLNQGRADSLDATAACALLRCDALLSVRVDQWEQRELEWNQSGKPTTSVRLRAALVDSTGVLLWSATGSRTGEGPYHNAETAPLGVKQSGLDRRPITGQGGAPSHLEVMEPIIERWAEAFPARGGTPSATPGGDGGPDR